MTKKIISAFAVAGLLLQSVACSTHRAHVKYSDFKSEMPIKSGQWNGEEMGSVEGEDGGAIWDNCSEKAKGSIREMIENARKMDANAIGNIKWSASENSTATCKKSWGYTLLWPFLLTPLFMSTRVTGIAYKVKGKKKRAGLYLLPENQEAEAALIEEIYAAL